VFGGPINLSRSVRYSGDSVIESPSPVDPYV